jgi:hypothetical protein
MSFLGGSAPAMALQVGEGYSLLSAVHLKRMSGQEMSQLQMELERILRDARSEIAAQDDLPALQARNRRMSRVTAALQQMQAYRSRYRI